MPGLPRLTRGRPRLVAALVAGLLALAGCAEARLALHAFKEARRGIEGGQSAGTDLYKLDKAEVIERSVPAPAPPSAASPRYKLGTPYQISGAWYYPDYDPDYDRIGVASWYGPTFHGRPTANGERFDMNELTAAHPTLPMPSRVRVTNLENGRALVLRVNDRGPFVDGRIIDLSRRGAQLLGFHRQGVARVRVQYLGLDDLTPGKKPSPAKPSIVMASDPVAVVRKPKPALPSVALPPIKLKAPPGRDEASASLLIEVAVLRTQDRADRVGERVRPFGTVAIELERRGNRPVYPVRIGPVGSGAEAASILARLTRAGFTDSHIVAARHR